MIGETESQRETFAKVNDALSEWVRQHPHPNSPTISVMGRTYSPRELLDEVRQETPLSQRFLGFLGFLERSAIARQASPEELIYEMIKTNPCFTLRHD